MTLHLLVGLVLTAVSCNSKSNDDETTIAVTPALVAVKDFHLKKQDKVLENLDSVFFSIDLNSGVIFNADSLPKGTNVSKLVTSITFANSMTQADLTFRRVNGTDTTINYLKNPDDSIDFTYPVLLEVTAQNGEDKFSYQIKVNVHEQKPDSIVWNELATSVLPARFPNPVAQKTLYHDEKAYCLVEENNGEYTLATSSDLFEGIWTRASFEPGFEPDVESFTATPDAFYILNLYGDLFTSVDGQTWSPTGENWVGIIGAYGEALLGIRSEANNLLHTMYPMVEGFTETKLEEGFPVLNYSELGLIESEWADQPIAIMAGGQTQDGEITSAVWAYDGKSWAIINENVLPALDNPMLFRYVVYRDTNMAFKKREFDVWLLIGGMSAEGEMNRNVYLSYDNGVHWSIAPTLMQLSETVPSLRGADVVVAGTRLSADLAEAWTPLETKSRGSYEINGFDIYWICPYIYIFGGYTTEDDNSLNTKIYRGVLDRLRYTPNL